MARSVKQIIVGLAFAFSLFLSSRDIAAEGDGADLYVAPIMQQCQYWCWAAVIEMVADYYAVDVTQCELASYLTGTMCCDYFACAYPACNQTATTGQIHDILEDLKIENVLVPRALLESELQKELDAGRPVIIGFQGIFSGHVGIVDGYVPATIYTPAFYHFIDPYFGIFTVEYRQLRYGYQNGTALWMHSWYKIQLKEEED